MMKSGSVVPAVLLCMSMLRAGEWGDISGQFRFYSMIEENQDPLLDYHGTAVGGKILYRTPEWNRLHGAVALYTTRFVRDDVSEERVEPLASDRGSRYVAGLVDTTDFDAKSVTGVGEAYLRYVSGGNSFSAGRMKLNTPFINPQDGRMIPTLEQGMWAKSVSEKGWSYQGGYINGFWNRNTPEWKSAEDSLGYGYEMGNSSLSSAVPGNYYGNTVSKGVFVGNIGYSGLENVRFEMWDYYVENVFNLIYGEIRMHHSVGETQLHYAGQVIHEYETGDGGNGEDNRPDATNLEKAKSYMQEGEKSTTYGARIGVKYRGSGGSFSYTKTTDQGRFLFPREWGVEPLYTFQKRERSEGSGNCHAWLVSFEHDFAGMGMKGLNMSAGYGEYHKTDPKEWRYNKYGTPSYAQWNLDVFYRFAGMLNGVSAEYLMARKVARGETYQIAGPAEYNFVFRKNGMTLHNFVLNYDF